MGAMVLEGVPKVPLSDDHGIDRGTPIVRAYVEEFLDQHREAITGSVLEVGDSLLKNPGTCLRSCHRALRGGGSLLITVPALKRLNPRDPDGDYLRYTPAGLDLLLRRTWDGPFSVAWYGNLRACVAFLVSHVSEEIAPEELRFRDERFPLTVAARADKQRSPARRQESGEDAGPTAGPLAAGSAGPPAFRWRAR